ncbi:hypothetical protein Tco_0029564 [Tanacetum coccineum]
MQGFRESTDKSQKKHDSAIKNLGKKVEQLAQEVHASMTNESKSADQVKMEKVKRTSDDDGYPQPTPIIETPKEPRTFVEKVKCRIVKEQEKLFLESLEKLPVNTPLIDTLRQTPDYTKSLKELMSKKTRTKEVSMVKLNARCSAVFQNELPLKDREFYSSMYYW